MECYLLSGVLFNIYFENSLKKLREEFDKISPELPTTKIHQMKCNILMMQTWLQKMNKDILLKNNLKSNTLNTEYTQIECGNNDIELWRNVKKLVIRKT